MISQQILDGKLWLILIWPITENTFSTTSNSLFLEFIVKI